jgi:6-phosphogluconolactonase
MTIDPELLIHSDAEDLAFSVAERLITAIADAQSTGGVAQVVLTGGRVAAVVYRAVAGSPARVEVDWQRVEFWWGDERFLPDGDPERNETQAREALLDHLPLDPARVHPMPPSDGPDGDDPDAAAARYAAELAAAAAAGAGTAGLPRFDVLMLGVGEDGHVASVFPGHAVAGEAAPVAAVRNSPKPPPVRLTLTLPTINTADEVWFVAAGADKSRAVGTALAGEGPPPTGAGPARLPAARVRGAGRTRWLLDRAAAADVPESLRVPR